MTLIIKALRYILDLNVSMLSILIQENHIGDYSSIIALIITVIGFGITILQLTKTKKASEIATSAVNAIRDDLKKIDTLTSLSSVVTEMEEIKHLQREKNLLKLPEKYAKLRTSLITIKGFSSIFAEEDLKIIQGTITQLSASEEAIDIHFENTISSTLKVSKLNGSISNHIDKLNEVLIRIKLKIGENS